MKVKIKEKGNIMAKTADKSKNVELSESDSWSEVEKIEHEIAIRAAQLKKLREIDEKLRSAEK